MQNISDQTGRGLEFKIASVFAERFGGSLTPRAMADQARDCVKFQQLPQGLADHFSRGANLVADIFAARYQLTGCVIDRLADSVAKTGDVTDIRLVLSNGQRLNLSVKNNHHALKHQRPPSLMQQLNFPKKSEEDIAYRNGLKQIYSSFYASAHTAAPQAVNFRDLKESDDTFIDSHLYAPICQYAVKHLQQHLACSAHCQYFFRFLVGNIDYLKIILNSSTLEIQYYSAIPLPTQATVSFSPDAPNMVYVYFDNGWDLSLRIHTAASSMGKTTPSLKFDTQPLRISVPQEVFSLF